MIEHQLHADADANKACPLRARREGFIAAGFTQGRISFQRRQRRGISPISGGNFVKIIGHHG